jgi:hypothetical protein
VARYTPTLPAAVYQRIGWPLSKLFGWQYAGTGDPTTPPANYPVITPMSKEKLDITALTIGGGGTNALKWLQGHLFAENPDQK